MTLALIALAGSLGALCRYGVSVAALRWAPGSFPWGTLCVNLVVCFALGWLAEIAIEDHGLAVRARAVAGTGFLGAFTTFSTFGVETFRALEAGEWGVAAGNVLINVVGGIALAAAGFYLARAV